MMVITETLPLAEVKAKLSEMVDRSSTLRIASPSRATVVRLRCLRSPDELASLEDTLDLLSDPAAMAQLRGAHAAVDAGDYVTGHDLRAKYPSC